MINDRAWTICACSAKEGEGIYQMKFFINILGLKEGVEWLM